MSRKARQHLGLTMPEFITLIEKHGITSEQPQQRGKRRQETTQWPDSFLLRQNGYLRTSERRVWLSWGWSYEFPVQVEDSRHYTLQPSSKLDVFENPSNTFFEGPSRLINDDTGETAGVAVTESMDVRIMHNAPYAAHQH